MPEIIQSNPKVLGGQPVIRGTRIPISRVMALIGMNYTLANIKRELPDLKTLKKEDISKILSYYQTQLAR
ncbi:MAG: hypothetical protein UX88_C0026G0002 [Candidatus Woesebacteria bacterium GW2011_GWC2_47_16]|uniref:DUF433 domain-containing protein n=6 Tax=Candidatus Woeseibacteriota TaxID=1752722 RepID=A0A0G1SZ12_9BACT|nr:MAG: hypothetical protein UX03_C0009G0018 [Candidatus Woesebacteria bacterium GW2011_GWE1_45_18]KKU47168.1 MAG: hypothetical protein UX67_C0047G0003 [Candidatus Woesebacteria bacterium GW2011_GWF2_46_8]KKU63553.1 MAG: hypothetical protein UX88_C0026G0002 [Candidatus Woesebacteria bacterium GW2011_GWC2_47_16]OGM82645.1 MAG: hypothetical protein A2376_00805 [Candidatus Woesebacteria bacterium RIFOXYB1_FULL_47_31]OGM84877.1 MAG: hypothetical protein A2435_00530 [Candidatus Woesebacteria bacteri